eukprot:6980261-Pyramimonas_sp.AAC.1
MQASSDDYSLLCSNLPPAEGTRPTQAQDRCIRPPGLGQGGRHAAPGTQDGPGQGGGGHVQTPPPERRPAAWSAAS